MTITDDLNKSFLDYLERLVPECFAIQRMMRNEILEFERSKLFETKVKMLVYEELNEFVFNTHAFAALFGLGLTTITRMFRSIHLT